MRYAGIFSFEVKWNYKSICLFLFLLAIPNLLGMLNLSTPFGFKLHFFQVGIFLAAVLYGPLGGMMSGAIGSVYSAALMGNPYLVIGNAILGFFTGLFIRYGFSLVVAVALAFMIQLPWLVISDFYFMQLPMRFVGALVIALVISNLIWGFVASRAVRPFKSVLE